MKTLWLKENEAMDRVALQERIKPMHVLVTVSPGQPVHVNQNLQFVSCVGNRTSGVNPSSAQMS
jgi:hypothetical protein